MDDSPTGVLPHAALARENAALRQYLLTLGDIALAGDVLLDELLQRIVDSARALLDARYSALGVFDTRGKVRQFFTSGLSAEERVRIGALPCGRGLLGIIARERRIVRTERITEHPVSSGFPPHHPPMTSFLGVPIARGDTVIGNLYLTDRLDGQPFSARDEELLTLLAHQAAIAIENAQRFERVRRREHTTSALFAIARELARLSEPDAVLALVVQEARRLLGADVSALCVRQAGEPLPRWVIVREERGRLETTASVPITGNLASQVLETGRPFASEDVATLPQEHLVDALLQDLEVRRVLLVPLGQERPPRDALLVGWRLTGPLPEDGQQVLERLADRAAIALSQTELSAREQAALHQSELERASLEAIFDSLQDAVFTTDPQGRLRWLNRRAATWAELPPEAALGHPAEALFLLVDEVGRPRRWDDVASYLGDATYLQRPHGDRLPVELVRSPIRGAAGQVLGMVSVLRDLRAQRQVEQLKANIISLVSHELRTPLSHIKGYASTLLQPDVEWDRETQRDFLASIEQQTDRLGRLISDLLEISRLDAGGAAQLERVAIAPAVLIEHALRQATPNAGGHPLLTVDAEAPTVFADPGQIERVLGNLIENAAKYSAEGAPITISVVPRDGEVVFVIRDQGIGMSAEEQRHLFERFYRAPRVKHRAPGTGLGLAICQEIIEAHGGAIWVESAEGRGTTVRFSVPCATDGREEGNA